jgi:alkanesulfonate monooxygenase SsuD/methylene tetrahydromethanopterin reductase-like flavin-dependent oxidoreductase (luciferase family)
MVEKFFVDGVPVEPRHHAQAPGDGGSDPAAGFQIAARQALPLACQYLSLTEWDRAYSLRIKGCQ